MKQVIVNPLPAPLALTYYIPELSSDPVSPASGDSWVLVTQSGSGGTGGGDPIGMLLALTNAPTGGSISYTYKFSYYTNEGSIVRTALS